MRFVIGDIHGMRGMLESLLSVLREYSPREIIFLGDYIDKGPDPLGVLDMVMAPDIGCRSVYLMGNHEHVLLEYLDGREDRREFLEKYGGERFLSEDKGGLSPDHIAFMRNLKYYYFPEGGEFVCVHAGLKREYDLEAGDFDPEKLVFLRKEFINSRFLYKGRKVVFGHTASGRPYVDGTKIGVDTGAVYTLEGKPGKLSAFELDGKWFIDHEGNVVDLKYIGEKNEDQ